MTKLLFAITVAVAATISACNKPAEYLYVHPEHQRVVHDHKVKEMSGTSDLDILWVIDDSGSMATHQKTVIANTDQFIDGLVRNTALKWKGALISTSLTRQPLIGMRPGDELDHSMPDAANRFKNAVMRLGTGGDSKERTYEPIINSLATFPTFLRPNAILAIILISDAPEQSMMTTASFVQAVTQMKGGDPDKVLFYGFINPTEWCKATDDPFTYAGSKFEELLKLVKGGTYKLCDPLFGKNLADLGAHLAKQVTAPMILLQDRPIVESIRVLHGNTNIPGGPGGFWSYDIDRNAVVFNDLSFAPADNEIVRVVYDIDNGKR